MGTKLEGNNQFMFTNSKQYPPERLIFHAKKPNTKLEKTNRELVGDALTPSMFRKRYSPLSCEI
jgi:hypothetical protein